MKDYYADFLTKNFQNTSESEVSKVSKVVEKDEKGAFDTFDTTSTNKIQKNILLAELFKNTELKKQFEFEVKERTAIMLADGVLSECEAFALARRDVEETWFGLFFDGELPVKKCH
jgi:hypothetical protein